MPVGAQKTDEAHKAGGKEAGAAQRAMPLLKQQAHEDSRSPKRQGGRACRVAHLANADLSPMHPAQRLGVGLSAVLARPRLGAWTAPAVRPAVAGQPQASEFLPYEELNMAQREHIGEYIGLRKSACRTISNTNCTSNPLRKISGRFEMPSVLPRIARPLDASRGVVPGRWNNLHRSHRRPCHSVGRPRTLFSGQLSPLSALRWQAMLQPQLLGILWPSA